MAYKFVVESCAELESLQWIADRYQYAFELERALLGSTSDDPDWTIDSELYPVTFDLPEHAAWAVQAAVEAEDGYLPCMGGRLAGELEKLLGAIV